MNRMSIGKHFEFEAAHQLPDQEIYGKCRNLHGHRYHLIVEVSGDINQDGWLCNFSEVKQIVQREVIDFLDHSFLNDIIPYQTTAENILFFISHLIGTKINQIGTEQFPIKLYRLTLYETSKSFAMLQFE